MTLPKLQINGAQRALIIKYFKRVMPAHAVQETLDTVLKILCPENFCFYPPDEVDEDNEQPNSPAIDVKDAVIEAGLAMSYSEVRKMAVQMDIFVNGVRCENASDANKAISPADTIELDIGKGYIIKCVDGKWTHVRKP